MTRRERRFLPLRHSLLRLNGLLLLLSDGIGALAGVMLAIPPLKDQYIRLRELQQIRTGKQKSLPKLHQLVANALKAKRETFSGYDTFLLALGSIGLVVSFALKGWDL